MIRICKQCGEYYNGFRPNDYGSVHMCGKRRCRFCTEMVEYTSHLCYMRPDGDADTAINDVVGGCSGNATNQDAEVDTEPCRKRARSNSVAQHQKQQQQPYTYVFWDSEARQENNGLHEANLFVAHIVCEMCIDSAEPANCTQRHEKSFVCYTTDEFGRFALKQRRATFIAHNFKGYDSQFVLDFCRSNGVKPEVIMNGQKCTYLQLTVQAVRFIDSYNFLPMALSKFPETFGFTERRKGHFPHFFNTVANANYIGPLPAKHYYGYQHMRVEQRTEFDRWYDAELAKGTVFNMREDILSYCDNDVAVLRIGCAQFRRLLLKIAKTDPFREAITIASTAQLIFRKMFLKPKQIGIIPANGYRPTANQSTKALQWLTWLAATRNITIRDCRHANGEFSVGRYKVDGYDEQNKTVYEFLGSYWHGDLNVYASNTFNQRLMCPMGVLNDRTLHRQMEIERSGYRYVAMWESEWTAFLKSNPDAREIVENAEITTPLEPRDAFFGGRTNACRLYYKQPEDASTKVRYVDFCSLYPTVNKYGRYPLGHPTIITEFNNGEDRIIDTYFGLIKCAILPPRDLYHPVLPYRHPDGKLMFPLCIKCADKYYTYACTHSEAQRKWIGTWTSVELQHAVSRGYKILRIFEVWHFPDTTQYNRAESTGGLFAEYVNMFMKIKQEASGLPANVNTDTEITAYINDFEHREGGVRLEREKIALNPGLRYTAKLFLNSLWGKFGQRSNLPRTAFVDTATELNGLLQRQDVEVNELLEFKGPTIEDDICQVQYKMKTDCVEESATTNIFVAAFTTAHARLMLLKEMEKLDRRVLYYDTDSIIYVSSDAFEEPSTGCFLGELTHELKPGEHIVEFFSGGPKNYGYKTSIGKFVQKHKGITLNAHVLNTLTFEAARNLVCESAYSATAAARGELAVDMQQIRRLPKGNGLQTILLRKRYAFHYDKRVIVADYDTLPYGHVLIPNDTSI